MKLFSIAVAVAIMLTSICLQENSAAPVNEVQEFEAMSSNSSSASQEETSVETWMMPFDIREKSYAAPIRCQFCCDCCNIGVCSLCCK
ncbi:hepcidin-like isoform X2 [Melanotaenia boesemani]|uniref:hepcidin-like isoform X2 n=1 Tax=Melanotaenia boesemani TaxID=1250792 RepID=UPI001C03CC71|nr:hepcidin-like isoform X2 [Melanotaenia boesemani]